MWRQLYYCWWMNCHVILLYVNTWGVSYSLWCNVDWLHCLSGLIGTSVVCYFAHNCQDINQLEKSITLERRKLINCIKILWYIMNDLMPNVSICRLFVSLTVNWLGLASGQSSCWHTLSARRSMSTMSDLHTHTDYRSVSWSRLVSRAMS